MFGRKIWTCSSKTFNSLNIKNDRSYSSILNPDVDKGIKPSEIFDEKGYKLWR